MKYIFNLTISAFVLALVFAFTTTGGKLTSNKTHIKFFSHTSIEDISANNYKAVSTLDKTTGDVVFSVPMQSFDFEKALMQKHYNSKDFLNTKKFPKAKMVGKITNLSDIKFDTDGTYSATIKGEMTLKGVTKTIEEKGSIKVSGKTVKVDSKFKLLLADYGIEFSKGKPASNIAKTVDVTLIAEYKSE